MRMNYELVAHGNSHDTEVEEREVKTLDNMLSLRLKRQVIQK